MSPRSNQSITMHLAFWLSFFALGLPYWMQSYADLTLPNSLFGIGTPVVLLSALVLRGINELKLGLAILIPAAAAPAVVFLRIIVEVFLVAGSHNLWPFELIIASLSGLLLAGMGGVVGILIAKLKRN